MQVSLMPMNDEEFSDYLDAAVLAYAKNNIDSGRWDEFEAFERSKETHKSLLPEGMQTKDNYLFNVIESKNSNKVGYIWVKVEENISIKSAFIYDIGIYDSYRRQGYAKSTLRSIEKKVSDLGATSLGLHVFNHNSVAIALYDSMGYKTVSQNMQKKIDRVYLDKK